VTDGRRKLELDDPATAPQGPFAHPRRGREDGEDTAAQTSGAHARQVEMSARPPACESIVIVARKGVVVAVEDGLHEGQNLRPARSRLA
jgi:hypothetical protein